MVPGTLGIRPEWLYDVVREVQVAAGEQTAILDSGIVRTAQGTIQGTRKLLRLVSQRIPQPSNAVEELVVVGLLNQLAIRLGGPVRNACLDTPPDGRSLSAAHRPCIKSASVTVAQRAGQFIQDNYRHRMTIQTIARAVRCHPMHLQRVFRQVFGQTVHTYVRAVTVQAGCELLLCSDTKISAIPFLVGYRSRAAFYRDIRQIRGCLPSQVRLGSTGAHKTTIEKTGELCGQGEGGGRDT
jgi:AraC-like DNA-binding protein